MENDRYKNGEIFDNIRLYYVEWNNKKNEIRICISFFLNAVDISFE